MTQAAPAARYAALAVSSRRRLLDVLQGAAEPLDIEQLASAVGLHATTARVHLEVLARAGLVRRTTQRAGRPGRPRWRYAAVSQSAQGQGYRQLAEVLAAELAADPDVGRRSERAGWSWATQQVPAEAARSWDRATRDVGELFDRLGFTPRLADQASYRHLELDTCPFRDTARDYPQVVCKIHLGLLRGALHQFGISPAEAQLRPFVEPDLCIADIPIPGESRTGERGFEPTG